MENTRSKQEELERDLLNLFDQTMKSPIVDKTHIIKIALKFTALKKENPEKYTSIANRSIGFVRSNSNVIFRGKAISKEWEKLKHLERDFRIMCPIVRNSLKKRLSLSFFFASLLSPGIGYQGIFFLQKKRRSRRDGKSIESTYKNTITPQYSQYDYMSTLVEQYHLAGYLQGRLSSWVKIL